MEPKLLKTEINGIQLSITLCIIMVMYLFQIQSVQAQNVLIFQPGPGMNNGTDEGGKNGGKDAFSFKVNPSTNYPDDVSFAAYPQSNCNDFNGELYFKFDVSSLPIVSEVDSVFVGFVHNAHTGNCFSNCEADFYFHRVMEGWSETTITYNNAPTVDSTPFFGPRNIKFPNDYGRVEYNITAMYKLWRSGAVANHGFQIYSPTVGCNNAAVTFSVSSSDNATDSIRPYLRIKGSFVLSAPDNNWNTNLKIFPNPTTEMLFMEGMAGSHNKFSIVVTDMLGRTVKEMNVEDDGNRLVVFIGSLKPGVYQLSISDGSNTVIKTFMKQ